LGRHHAFAGVDNRRTTQPDLRTGNWSGCAITDCCFLDRPGRKNWLDRPLIGASADLSQGFPLGNLGRALVSPTAQVRLAASAPWLGPQRWETIGSQGSERDSYFAAVLSASGSALVPPARRPMSRGCLSLILPAQGLWQRMRRNFKRTHRRRVLGAAAIPYPSPADAARLPAVRRFPCCSDPPSGNGCCRGRRWPEGGSCARARHWH
jgi:hypothetical protein